MELRRQLNISSTLGNLCLGNVTLSRDDVTLIRNTLDECKSLRWVYLANINFEFGALDSFACTIFTSGRPSVEKLSLVNMHDAEVVRDLLRFTRHSYYGLRRLTLRNVPLDMNAVRYIGNDLETFSLSDIGLSTTAIDSFTNMLRRSRGLCMLKLRNLDISENEWKLVLDAVASARRVSTIDLSMNRWGDESLSSLVWLICTMGTLRMLKLQSSKWPDMSAYVSESTRTRRGEAMLAMAHAIAANDSLRDVDFLEVDFNVLPITFLSNIIGGISTLKILRINGCHVPDESMRAFADVLRNNYTLQCLSMCWAHVSETSMCALLDAVAANDTLDTLRLIGAYSDGRVWDSMHRMLAGQSSLTSLDISSPYLPTQTFIGNIAAGLARNTKLATLIAMGHKVELPDVSALLECMRRNTTLTTLDLFTDKMREQHPFGIKEIERALEANAKRQVKESQDSTAALSVDDDDVPTHEEKRLCHVDSRVVL